MERNANSPQIQRVDPDEPIAIIGIGCRFPGSAADPASFWKLLTNEVDAITEVPGSRWNLDDYYDPKPQRGKTYAKWGGFLDQVDGFDAAYFGITPREAQAMDPQQRLLLETAVEAIDDGGQTPEHFRGRRTGVFVGLWGSDYEDFLFNDPAGMDFYRTQGTGRYTAAGRLSFTLGLDGPSMAVDTACSSSLVTVHLACQSLRERGCEMALAGGVNLLLQPQITIAYSQSRMMAKDGRCRFGDATGSGYVRAEGAGLILLKPLEDAVADNDPIYAVVRGSAVNNDARTSGSFGTPGVRGQEAMLRQAYRTAGVDPREVRYVEAHGTGTKRGDPVEVRALSNVLCENRPEDDTLLIGSVKTNVGHMEAAAGIGGLVKTALVLDRGLVPPSLHFKEPNPNIPWDRLPIRIPTEVMELPRDAQVRFASVNSFGIGGTNAHVVMEEAPAPSRQAADDSIGRFVLNLTARAPEALRELASRYLALLEENEDLPLADVCYTLSARRSLHGHRLAVAGRDRAELIEQLQAYLAEEERPGLVAGEDAYEYERGPDRRVAFVYSGQGSQWIGMGRELLEREEVFRIIIEECDREIKSLAGWSLIEELQKDEGSSRLGDIEVMWPAIFSMQVALTELLKHYGIRPAAVVGHSIGEAAAAWASGSISLADAVRVIVTQGKLVHETSGQGGMALIGLPFHEAEAEVEKYGGKLVAAIEASPKSTVLSGDITALDEVVRDLEGRDILARRVNTPAAVHCALMDPLKDRLLEQLKDLSLQSAAIPFYSATLGMAYDGHRLDAGYWWDNIREPVLFKSAVDAIVDDHVDAFLEVSPHAIVERSIEECLSEHQAKGVAASTLRSESDEAAALERALSKLASGGVEVDLDRLRRDSSLNPLRLHDGRPRVAFVFSGQGPQWYAMGRELFEREPIYRNKIEEIDALLQQAQKKAGHDTWSLLDELNKDEGASRIMDTEIAQPAIFALQVGLAELWKSWGVLPDAITGHSVGEVAAAHVSGKLSLEDAVTVIYHRGRLMQEATGLGKMAAVQLTLEACEKYLAGYEGRVEIGVANSPGSSVLSGETAALEEILAKIEQDGIYQKMLPNNYAFHSPQMEPFKEKMSAEMKKLGLQARAPETPIVSTVTGKLAGDEDYGAEYWGQNIRGSVLFVTAVDVLIDAGYDLFLEIGPHPVLSGYVNECLERAEARGHTVASLNRKQPEHLHLLGNLGKLFTLGYTIDWERYFDGRGRAQRLPAYAWQRERYWIDPPKRGAAEGRALSNTPHPLLQSRIAAAEPIVQALLLRENDTAPLFGHSLFEIMTLTPGDSLEATLLAVDEHLRTVQDSNKTLVLRDLQIERPVGLFDDEAVEIQLLLSANDFRAYDRIESEDGGEWRRHLYGKVSLEIPGTVRDEDIAPKFRGFSQSIAPNDFYDTLADAGVHFEEGMRAAVTEIRTKDAEAIASLEPGALPDATVFSFGFALFQALFREDAAPGHLYTPCSIDRIRLVSRWQKASVAWLEARLDASTGQNLNGSLRFYGADGTVLIEMSHLRFRAMSHPDLMLVSPKGIRDWLYEPKWVEASLRPEHQTGTYDGYLVIGSGTSAVDEAVAGVLGQDGTEIQMISSIDLARTYLARGGSFGIVYLRGLSERDESTDLARQEALCKDLITLVQNMAEYDVDARLMIVTRGAQPVHTEAVPDYHAATLWGMGSVIASEFPQWRPLRLDLDPREEPVAGARLILEELISSGGDSQVGYRGGLRYVQRLDRKAVARDSGGRTSATREPVVLETTGRGLIDNLTVHPLQRRMPGPDEVEIEVAYTGLNFRDVLSALDMYPEGPVPFGIECAGRIASVGENVIDLSVGDQVMGLCVEPGFASYVVTPADLVIRKPSTLNLEAAAGVPLVFLTCYYALNHLARISGDDRILIHSAAGGVGLAAIQVARMEGAKIFATVSTDEKRQYLESIGVEPDCIFDSRSTDFATRIMELTNGEGIDIVLNSLSGEFIPKGIEILRKNGRFLEIGKKDIFSAKDVAAIKKGVSYFVIDLMDVAHKTPDLIQSMLLHLSEEFENGNLATEPLTQFDFAHVRDAFRQMARGKHIGKLVVSHEQARVAAQTFEGFREDGTYLITGGLGDLGLFFARRLASSGAGNIVLTGRREPREEVKEKIRAIEEETGARVQVLRGDVSQTEDVRKILASMDAGMPALRGIVHAAGVIDDGLFRDQTWERYAKVMQAKVAGSQALHEMTVGRSLDFFVFFSSIASLLGLPAQSNYSAANAFMDALAHQRRSMGLPGLSIHWGPWAQIGMVADLAASEEGTRLRRTGTSFMPPELGWQAFEHLLHSGAAEAGVIHVQWDTFAQMLPGGIVPGYLSELISEIGGESGAGGAGSTAGILDSLASTPVNRREEVLLGYLRDQVRQILGMKPNQPVDPSKGFKDVGMDSLMTVEFRNRLQQGLDTTLPSTLAFDYPNLNTLTTFLLEQALTLPGPESEGAASDPEEAPALVAAPALPASPAAEVLRGEDVDALSEEDAESMLLAELDIFKARQSGQRRRPARPQAKSVANPVAAPAPNTAPPRPESKASDVNVQTSDVKPAAPSAEVNSNGSSGGSENGKPGVLSADQLDSISDDEAEQLLQAELKIFGQRKSQ